MCQAIARVVLCAMQRNPKDLVAAQLGTQQLPRTSTVARGYAAHTIIMRTRHHTRTRTQATKDTRVRTESDHDVNMTMS